MRNAIFIKILEASFSQHRFPAHNKPTRKETLLHCSSPAVSPIPVTSKNCLLLHKYSQELIRNSINMLSQPAEKQKLKTVSLCHLCMIFFSLLQQNPSGGNTSHCHSHPQLHNRAMPAPTKGICAPLPSWHLLTQLPLHTQAGLSHWKDHSRESNIYAASSSATSHLTCPKSRCSHALQKVQPPFGFNL